MKKDGISRTQLMALLWAGLMAPAAELLPSLLLPQAGKGAWLAVALAGPVVLGLGWMLGQLAGRQGLAQGFLGLLGKWPGRALILLYIVWAQLLLALRLRLCAQRLLISGNRDGSVWFFLLAVAGVLLWMGRGKLAAFARAGQIFLAALLCAALVVLGLSLVQARPERLLPLWWGDGLPMVKAAVQVTGVMGWGLFAAFLLGSVRDQGEKKGWHWLFWGLGGTLLLAGAQAVILGNLGAGLAMELNNPFFFLAKSVGVEGAFQRVEGIISALWTFADLTMGGVLVFSIRAMGRELVPEGLRNCIPYLSVGLAALGGLVFAPGAGIIQLMGEKIVPAGNLILGAWVPLVLYVWMLVHHKGEISGISCDKTRKKHKIQEPWKRLKKSKKSY